MRVIDWAGGLFLWIEDGIQKGEGVIMKKKILWSIVIILAILVAAAGWELYCIYRDFTSPWGTEQDRFLIEIEEGKNATQIAHLLHEKGIVPNVQVFLIMADLRGITAKLQAGEYEFKGTQSPYEVLDILATGQKYLHALTIPEGFTQLQIAQRCDEMKICPKEDFLQFAQNNPVFRFVVAQAPGGANAASEGALFPDTYYLQKNTPPIKIFERFSRRFSAVINELFDTAVEKQKERGAPWWWQDDNLIEDRQIHQVVVMASIVEKEAKRPEDRPLVASVIVNRLKKEMPLQMDSTIHYLLNDWSRPLTAEDKAIESPYNTYKHKGLPPAAICNPGRAALEAAFMPPDTTYLYFISLPTGETKFFATLEDHVKMKNDLKQARHDAQAAQQTADQPAAAELPAEAQPEAAAARAVSEEAAPAMPESAAPGVTQPVESVTNP